MKMRQPTPGSFVLLAPYREPRLTDTEAGLSKLIQQRTIDGSIFTYVRRVDSRKLKYVFDIPRNKMIEVRNYIFDYLSTPMSLQNWKGEIWYGYITNNPFNMQTKTRSMECDIEDSEIQIEFEGIRIH